MPTDHIKHLLPDYLTGAMDAELRKGIESHLHTCPVCQTELEQLKSVFDLLQASRPAQPSPAYFSSLLPRIRLRLEKRVRFPILSHPVVLRIVPPLAVAVVAIVLLLHVPFSEQGVAPEQNALRSVVGNVSADELALVILEQSQQPPFVSTIAENEVSSTLSVRTLESELFKGESNVTITTASELVLGAATASALMELNDSEVEVLLQRLGERTIL